VRGVQWCDASNTFGCMSFTRDANAALNIRWYLLSGAARPLHLPKLNGGLTAWIANGATVCGGAVHVLEQAYGQPHIWCKTYLLATSIQGAAQAPPAGGPIMAACMLR
jgi:hypothetical protein